MFVSDPVPPPLCWDLGFTEEVLWAFQAKLLFDIGPPMLCWPEFMFNCLFTFCGCLAYGPALVMDPCVSEMFIESLNLFVLAAVLAPAVEYPLTFS